MSTYYNQYGKKCASDKYALAKCEKDKYYLRIHPLYDEIVDVKERFLIEEITNGQWIEVSELLFDIYLNYLVTRNVVLYYEVLNKINEQFKQKRSNQSRSVKWREKNDQK